MTDLISLQELDKAIERGLREVYLDALVLNTPKDTGFTAKSWKLIKNGAFNYELVNDATTKDGDSIALMLEEGTRPHVIKPKTKKALKFEKGGKDVFAKEVRHPGFAARLFIQEVLDRQDLFKKFEAIVFSGID